ncbi:hypothetical protein Glove_120g148 [Diversispora epigaea]|uniref:Uncharacterized protein n=1 Tax=Diversispora epigaea TaxID=1348612 RepID=A0A397J619_9GLOM|nr:hypothetical protein Glove_120g148 [Diversispora epigaea]
MIVDLAQLMMNRQYGEGNFHFLLCKRSRISANNSWMVIYVKESMLCFGLNISMAHHNILRCVGTASLTVDLSRSMFGKWASCSC